MTARASNRCPIQQTLCSDVNTK